MKKILSIPCLFVLLGILAAQWPCLAQTTYFNDTFTNGSTVNTNTLLYPTTNAASYQVVSSVVWFPPATVTNNDLRYGIGSAGSGNICEIQAVFTTNQVALSQPGDYIQLTIIYTNFSGLWAGGGSISAISTGLYNSGGVQPLAGGMGSASTNQEGTLLTSGGAQGWQGYTVEVGNSGSSPHYDIYARPAQAANEPYTQDVTSQGSSSKSFAGAVTINGGGLAAYPPATTNVCYTNILNITLLSPTSLAITNSLYNYTGLVTITNGIATNSSFLVSSFDSLAMGFYKKTDSSLSNVLDIASINVSGHTTVISTPPTITVQPASVQVATNGACAFSVTAVGYGVTYQWTRSGTNLVDGGNISGSTSSLLEISQATVSDEVNSYGCTITGTGNYSTNSSTASLTLIASTNLIWNDDNSFTWDLNNSVNWQDTNGDLLTFNFGDPVVFNDIGGGGPVNITGPYLSPSSLTVSSTNSGYSYIFQGTGSIAGPTALNYIGQGGLGASELIISNANTYTGGTIISNAVAHLVLGNLSGLGTGPITLAQAGGQMNIEPAGNANAGIASDIIVADNFQIVLDASSNSYSGVFNGDFSGTSGKTLTFTNGTGYTGGVDRIRAAGNATTYNGNLNLASSAILLASYSSGTQAYNGVISGPGSFMEKGTITYFNGPNTYSGGTTPAQGIMAFGLSSSGSPTVTSGPIGTGPLLLNLDSSSELLASGMIEASVPNVTIANAIECVSGTNNLTLQVGGSNNLTLAGPFTLNGNDGLTTNTITSRFVQATNTGLTTISGVISDGGKNYGFGSIGTGVLALNNTETYTGPTVVSNGTLLVNGQIGSGAVTVATNATLGGSGTINGAVTIQNGGNLAAGNQAIGTLTINNALSLAAGSTNIVNISSGSSSKVTGLTSVTYGGTLVPNIVSGTFTAGQTFTIFSAASESGSFSSIAGSPGAGLSWLFTPSTGVLSVVGGSPVIPNVPPRITSVSISGGNVTITATNGVNNGTYYLLGTTNLSARPVIWVPVATNVVTASGGSGTFSFAGTNAYPTGFPMWFFTLSSTNN